MQSTFHNVHEIMGWTKPEEKKFAENGSALTARQSSSQSPLPPTTHLHFSELMR
jgi:hypothetical protein